MLTGRKWIVVVLSSLISVLVAFSIHQMTRICCKRTVVGELLDSSESTKLELYGFDTDSLLWKIRNDAFVFRCGNLATTLELKSDGTVSVNGEVEYVDRRKVVRTLVSLVESGLFFVSRDGIRYQHVLLEGKGVESILAGQEVQISLELDDKVLYYEIFPNFSTYYHIGAVVNDAAILTKAYDLLNDLSADGSRGIWERNTML